MHTIALTVLIIVSLALVALQLYVTLRFNVSNRVARGITRRVARYAMTLVAVAVAIAMIALAPSALHALFIFALATPSLAMLHYTQPSPFTPENNYAETILTVHPLPNHTLRRRRMAM